MKDIIHVLPEQIITATKLILPGVLKKKEINKILVCGMGGSGISGEILRVLYPSLPIISNKDYEIPEYIDSHTLGILVSYSGNTEETLNNYQMLCKSQASLAVISSNGKLLKKKADIKVKIPGGLPPRGALGYLFTPLPLVLWKYRICENPRAELLSLARYLMKWRKPIARKARTIAKKLVKKLPLIYADSKAFQIVAQRWQCQLNENSKILAHINVVPEMNHNEIVGLGRPRSLNRAIIPIFLRDPYAYKRNKARVKVMQRIIRPIFAQTVNMMPPRRSNMKNIFWTIMMGDFISYYLAVLTNVDPMPVKRIDYLKKELSKL